ncbi:C25 family cysteine peptidase [Chloroflexota bacterium]
MKTARSLALAGALTLLLLVMLGLKAAAAPPTPDVRLIDSSADGLTFEVTVPEPRRVPAAPDRSISGELALDGYAPGPEGLPIRDLLLALPPSGVAKVSVEPLAPQRTVEGPGLAVPVPNIVEEENGLVLRAGWEWQPLKDEAHHLPLATLIEEGFLREWRVARLRLAPMAYLGDGQWELTPHFRVRVVFDDSIKVAESPGLSSPSALVQGALVNGEQAAGWRSSEPPLRPATVYNLPETAWRIGITGDGLYRLSYEALDAAQVPIPRNNPAAAHLMWRGQEVALQEVGMGDGTFDPGDAFLFYGQRFHGSVKDAKYTDENVYWLAVDPGTAGLRMATRPAPPNGSAPAAAWYPFTVRAEEDNDYWGRWSTVPGTDATWFWERVVATSPVTRTYQVELNALSPTSYDGILRIEVASRNQTASNPDHHLRLSVNGTAVGEDLWEGMVGRVITMPFPSALLQEGANDVGMTLLTDVGVQDVYMNWVEATLRRRLVAQDDQLVFSAPFDGDAAYTLTGFTTNALHLYDLSDPLAPTILSGPGVVNAGPSWNLIFADQGTIGQLYLVLAEGEIQDAPALTRYEPDLDLLSSGKGADEIIIVPGEFYNAILPLADHRRGEGLRVEVVRVEDIYPLFNGGVLHPQAIRDFLAYTYDHWQAPAPAYVLLVGDGHFNFKGHNPARYGDPTPVYIPPYLDFVDPWQGEVPVDTRFGQIVGNDSLPDLAVGRLPANSVQEVRDVVAKIIAYEVGAIPNRPDQLIFASDNIPDAGGNFEAVLDRLADDFVPDWMRLERVYLTDYCGPPANPPTPCISATQALTQTWSQGAAMVTFIGHGAIHRWTHEPLLLNTQIDTLQPGHGLPLVMTFNCLDGYWAMPPKYPGFAEPQSMAEWMVMAADHGSIAGFSPSGLGTTSAEELIVRNMYNAMFNEGESRLGEIALVGQLTQVSYLPHLPEVSTLFGDPAGWLRMSRTKVHLPLILRE